MSKKYANTKVLFEYDGGHGWKEMKPVKKSWIKLHMIKIAEIGINNEHTEVWNLPFYYYNYPTNF